MDFGLPQGSVVGPGIFTYYINPIGMIIQKHNLRYHIYADDIQIYAEFNPKVPGDTVTALFKLSSCIHEIKVWMNTNKLKLNEEKTEFFIAGSKHNLNNISDISLDFCSTSIPPSTVIRNLGVLFDSHMTLGRMHKN